MEEIIGLRITPMDNVASVFTDVPGGTTVRMVGKSGESEQIALKCHVPYGHKFAAAAIAKGEKIIKYGEEIGIATADIPKGDYVHIHNLDSARARGDLEKPGKGNA